MNKLLVKFNKIWLSLAALVLMTGKSLALYAPSVGFTDLSTTINTIFEVVITVSAIAFVVLFLVGGIQYLTASGNEETSGKARKLLLDAIIGLVIVLAAWAVGSWILEILNVNVNLQEIN